MQVLISTIDVYSVIPEIIVGGGACLLLVIDLFLSKAKKHFIGYLSILFIIAAAIGTACLFDADRTVMAGMYSIDAYSACFKFILYLATVLTVLLSFNYIRVEGLEHKGEYYTLMLFALCGMMVMSSGADLLMIYLGLELMALPVYVLVGYMKGKSTSNEAAIKYIILGAFSTGIFLYGVSLVYGITGSTMLVDISSSLSGGTEFPTLLTLALVMISAGLCFKIAGFPFHMWAPDAYEGAPTSITAFMTVAAKTAAFAAMVRIFLQAFSPALPEWQMILIVVAVLSMIYGNIVAILQTNIKRMLAYSSIGHAGYALLGLVAGSRDGTGAIIFYMLVYVLMNIGAFAVIILMRKGDKNGDDIRSYKGLAKNNKLMALLMLVFLFALAGIPPTAGFMGKFYIFMALLDQGMFALAVVAVLASAIAAYFYIRIIVYMYMNEPEEEFELDRSKPVYVVLAVSLVGVLVLGVYPGCLIEIAQKAALIF